MNEMIKRRKDEGFTLIELMIVIAVIGILAVVLVPKVGSIKTQAKSAGVDTNVRTVQAYAQSKVNQWAYSSSIASDIQTDIANSYDVVSNRITNPISLSTVVGTDTVADTNALQVLTAAVVTKPKGGVVVVISGSGSTLSLVITGYDANAATTTSVTVVP